MNLGIVVLILAIHWVADFILQTDWQAKNKSKAWEPLLDHTFTYSCCWLSLIPVLGSTNTGIFILATFICHTTTDYFTSRVNAKLWERGEVHNFFVSVGFDQLMHYIQLLLTFKLLEL